MRHSRCNLPWRTMVPVLQLDIVKQDCSRLANENSTLHAQLIQAKERNEALQVGRPYLWW